MSDKSNKTKNTISKSFEEQNLYPTKISIPLYYSFDQPFYNKIIDNNKLMNDDNKEINNKNDSGSGSLYTIVEAEKLSNIHEESSSIN